MGSPEGISETPKIFSIAHDDYEALVDGMEVQVTCDHIPPNLEAGQVGHARNKETRGRLPVEILEISISEDNPRLGTIRMKLAQ